MQWGGSEELAIIANETSPLRTGNLNSGSNKHRRAGRIEEGCLHSGQMGRTHGSADPGLQRHLAVSAVEATRETLKKCPRGLNEGQGPARDCQK